jgi:hypothetical protein
MPVVKPKPQVQFLPQDELKVVQSKSDLQSLGRLATTCQYLSDNFQVKNFSKEQFGLVEKFLYHHAPKISLAAFENDAHDDETQQIKERLYSVINGHKQKIDSSIQYVYLPIKCSKFQEFFVDNLELTQDDRIAFYFGKLPGQINSLGDDSSNKESGDLHDPILSDIIDAAYQDAEGAILNYNIDRARVVLNRYEQFANFENELIEMLCFLGNGPLLVDYLSIPERGIENTAAANGLTAIEIARDECGNKALVAFLQSAIDATKK